MSAPVEFFTLRLLPGEIYHLDTIRDLQITNVSYSEPENLKGKKRSVLRVHYAGNPIDLEDDEDIEIEDDDEDEREDEDEDEEDEEDDEEDDEEEDDDDEDDIVDMEPRVPIFTDDDSYVVCSLIPEKVEQVTLNLQISEEEEVGLSVSGDEPVDIIGNYLLPTSLNNLDPELLGELEDEEDDEAPRDRKLIEGPRDDDDDEDEDEEDDDEDDDDDDEEDDDEEDEEDDEDEDEDGDIVIEDDDDDDDEDDEDDDEVLVEEDDDNDDDEDEEDIVIVPSKKRSVSDLDEDEPKLSRSQRKRLNKKLKAEASGQKQDKVRDVMASMLTDVLFNF